MFVEVAVCLGKGSGLPGLRTQWGKHSSLDMAELTLQVAVSLWWWRAYPQPCRSKGTASRDTQQGVTSVAVWEQHACPAVLGKLHSILFLSKNLISFLE